MIEQLVPNTPTLFCVFRVPALPNTNVLLPAPPLVPKVNWLVNELNTIVPSTVKVVFVLLPFVPTTTAPSTWRVPAKVAVTLAGKLAVIVEETTNTSLAPVKTVAAVPPPPMPPVSQLAGYCGAACAAVVK